jgi:hypothetical protein
MRDDEESLASVHENVLFAPDSRPLGETAGSVGARSG